MSLQLSSVSHRYGDRPPVLNGIDLEVGDDETVAIMGPSGSGKTTLLSIMGGLLAPTGGEVALDGARVGRGTPVSPGSFSWVFQTINLLGRRTALENVAIGLHAVGYLRAAATGGAKAALEAVGLSGMDPQLAMRLSGGEAQRVGIARALVGHPRYVLADEPTGQLDSASSEIVVEALFSGRPEGTSVVVATHDHAIAARCRRRFRLVDGRLWQET